MSGQVISVHVYQTPVRCVSWVYIRPDGSASVTAYWGYKIFRYIMTSCRWTCRKAAVPPLSGSSSTFLRLCDPEDEYNTILETSVSTRPTTKQNTSESPETRTDSHVHSWMGNNIRHKMSRITLGPCGEQSISYISTAGTTRMHVLARIRDRPETWAPRASY